jgi:hypothetical protein
MSTSWRSTGFPQPARLDQFPHLAFCYRLYMSDIHAEEVYAITIFSIAMHAHGPRGDGLAESPFSNSFCVPAVSRIVLRE